MQELTALLASGDESVNLDIAALQIATIEFPGLEIPLFVEMLDSYAAELNAKIDGADGYEYIRIANEYLFEELGFEGNDADYYNPLNSCLNEVLARRTGIPITLSIVYMEISRRLGRRVEGIGLPGHFLVRYEDGRISAVLDPFHKGRVLSPSDIRELAAQVAGIDISDNPTALEPVSRRQMALRMLNNLRGVYFRRQNHRKAVDVLNLLITATPDSAEEYKQRGIMYVELQDYRSAKSDLEHYLMLAGKAEDRQLVEQQLEKLRHWISVLN